MADPVLGSPDVSLGQPSKNKLPAAPQSAGGVRVVVEFDEFGGWVLADSFSKKLLIFGRAVVKVIAIRDDDLF